MLGVLLVYLVGCVFYAGIAVNEAASREIPEPMPAWFWFTLRTFGWPLILAVDVYVRLTHSDEEIAELIGRLSPRRYKVTMPIERIEENLASEIGDVLRKTELSDDVSSAIAFSLLARTRLQLGASPHDLARVLNAELARFLAQPPEPLFEGAKPCGEPQAVCGGVGDAPCASHAGPLGEGMRPCYERSSRGERLIGMFKKAFGFPSLSEVRKRKANWVARQKRWAWQQKARSKTASHLEWQRREFEEWRAWHRCKSRLGTPRALGLRPKFYSNQFVSKQGRLMKKAKRR